MGLSYAYVIFRSLYFKKQKYIFKIEIVAAKFLIPAMIILMLYIIIFGEGIISKVERYKEIKNLKSTEVDSIIYKSKKDRILVLNKEVINNIITHYNEMESTLNYGHGNLENSFVLYIYAKNEIKLEHNYSGLGNLIIEIPGVGEYYSEGLGYYFTKEYLSTSSKSGDFAAQ
jgi:hypothetical protein